MAQELTTEHETANRQMMENMFVMHMRTRVHGQLKMYATQMMKMMMILYMLPVMHVTFPQTASQKIGQSQRNRMEARMQKRRRTGSTKGIKTHRS